MLKNQNVALIFMRATFWFIYILKAIKLEQLFQERLVSCVEEYHAYML